MTNMYQQTQMYIYTYAHKTKPWLDKAMKQTQVQHKLNAYSMLPKT